MRMVVPTLHNMSSAKLFLKGSRDALMQFDAVDSRYAPTTAGSGTASASTSDAPNAASIARRS